MDNIQKYIQNSSHAKYFWMFVGGLGMYTYAKMLQQDSLYKKSLQQMKQEEREITNLNSRERTFIKFASCEHKGQLFMTPIDFLESLVSVEPRPRLKRIDLDEPTINRWLDDTPKHSIKKKLFLRKVRDKGIISYVEYLFLLSALIKPIHGFRVAFNMLDVDNNNYVEKDEFNIILKIISCKIKGSKIDNTSRKHLLSLVSTKEQAQLFFKQKTDKTDIAVKKDVKDENKVEGKDGETNIHVPTEIYIHLSKKEKMALEREYIDTTLMRYLFGKRGTRKLNFTEYKSFLSNLQNETIDYEFQELATGKNYITVSDFTSVLLYYSQLSTDEVQVYLTRVQNLTESKDLKSDTEEEFGILYEEYKDFMEFLNQISDFKMAVRAFVLVGRSISKDEFARAYLICTGKQITTNLLNTIFLIFDTDGDGHLSYTEFFDVMDDRLNRGVNKQAIYVGVDGFLHCIKNNANTKRDE